MVHLVALCLVTEKISMRKLKEKKTAGKAERRERESAWNIYL